jgi:hypothetical protein
MHPLYIYIYVCVCVCARARAHVHLMPYAIILVVKELCISSQLSWSLDRIPRQ